MYTTTDEKFDSINAADGENETSERDRLTRKIGVEVRRTVRNRIYLFIALILLF